MSSKAAASSIDKELPFDQDTRLWKWACHTDDSYHDFSEEEAARIREALLEWYRANRRKLPWRGDAPPFDGSTAGFGDVVAEKKKGQKSIKNFFASKEEVKKEIAPVEVEVGAEEALPMTGYGVWVSEIMLQQTRVEAVIPYYCKWMKRFPTVYDLAEASEEDVNAHWAGLGFYRRSRLLHQGAKLVVEKYNGELPQTTEGLLAITGIGPYTASAVASIAYDVCVPVVDGNVCRVLSRLRGIANNIKSPILKDKLGWRLAESIVKAGDGKHAGEVNQALMELGATYCAPSGTGTDDRDPLKKFYQSTKLAADFDGERKRLGKLGYECFPVDAYLEGARHKIGENATSCVMCETNMASVLTEWSDSWNGGDFTVSHGPFPLAPPKAAKREEVLAVGVLYNKNGKWLLVKRPKEGLLAGQWEFPCVCVWSSADEKIPKGKKRKTVEIPFVEESVRSKALTKYLGTLGIPKKSKRLMQQQSVEHVFSHVRHTMWIEHASLEQASTDESVNTEDGKELRWMSKEDMDKVGVTSGVKKILKTVEKASKEGTNKNKKVKKR